MFWSWEHQHSLDFLFSPRLVYQSPGPFCCSYMPMSIDVFRRKNLICMNGVQWKVCEENLNAFFILTIFKFIYLREQVKRETVRVGERERYIPFIGLFPKFSQPARIWELSPVLSWGWPGPNYLMYSVLSPSVCISTKVSWGVQPRFQTTHSVVDVNILNSTLITEVWRKYTFVYPLYVIRITTNFSYSYINFISSFVLLFSSFVYFKVVYLEYKLVYFSPSCCISQKTKIWDNNLCLSIFFIPELGM